MASLRHRWLSAAGVANSGIRQNVEAGGPGSVVRLFRRLLAVELCTSSLPVRTQPGPDGGCESQAVYAPADRHEPACEFHGEQLSGDSVVSDRRVAAAAHCRRVPGRAGCQELTCAL